MPAPGQAFVRYGGQTSCVALAHDGAPPSLVLDGGSGLVNFDEVLGERPFRGTILLSHLHWDHTHGLPFFAAGARAGHSVRILLPDQDVNAEALLARAFSPPHFPVPPSALGENWEFGTLSEGDHRIEQFSVLALEIPHKGGRTFGYRVSDGRRSIAYLPDHHPLLLGTGSSGAGELHQSAVALAKDVDLLIHDSQFLREELADQAWLGHSCADYALELAQAAGARHVCLFHHSPKRTDAALDEEAVRFADSAVPVTVCYDGLVLAAASASGSG